MYKFGPTVTMSLALYLVDGVHAENVKVLAVEYKFQLAISFSRPNVVLAEAVCAVIQIYKFPP
jgi:hypothetical protein